MSVSLAERKHTTVGRDSGVAATRRRSYTGSSSSSCSPPSSEASPIEGTFDATLLDQLHKKMSKATVSQTTIPALPAKSARRASRFFDNVPTKPGADSASKPLSVATPYDRYLSSEEDPSSSADDFSDFDVDSDSEQSPQNIARHHNAVTARVVSVIFAGKPSIVDLPPRSRSSGSSASTGSRRSDSSPTSCHRLSNSFSSSSSVAMFHPPRSSSRYQADSERQAPPGFLDTDPFASKHDGEDIERPKTPLTPASMFKRGISLVKKKSRPNLGPSGLYVRDNFSVQTLPVDPTEDRQARRPEDSPTGARGPVLYEDIMRSARMRARAAKESDAASIMTTTTASNVGRFRAGLGLGRRRSIKT